jgi:RecA-family ATPase
MSSSDFHVPIEPVALRILPEFMGEPNRSLSSRTELRWGRNGSLSVDLEGNTWFDHEDQTGGGVLDLLKSFKGLDKPDALKWLEDNGFLERRSKPNGEDKPRGKFAGFMDHHPIAIYEYRDDKGRLAYEVLKFPKDAPRRYMQRRKHSDGSWIWGLREGTYGKTKSGDWFKVKEGRTYSATETIPDAPRWLYRRDEVLKAKAEGRPIILCEGEKDAETVREWGFTATTNAGGAKYWQDSFNDDLAGADVIIIPDNDEPGRARANLRGAGLQGKAKSVRILDLSRHWPDMPEKADVTDWKEQAGGTAEQFAKLIKSAPRWEPERTRAFGAYYHDEIDGPGLELNYLIDGWITERGRSVLGGPSGSGKSFLALHMAYCIARGVDFFGYHVERGGVIYQAGEGGLGIKKRQKAYRKHFELPPEEDVPLVVLPAKVDLYARDGDTDRLIEAINSIKVTLSVPLKAVFIDTLATATIGADENSGKDMGVVLANIARIEEECGVHVCLVHHMNADGKKLRGHTSIHANVDTVIQVTVDESTKIRTAKLRKQKDDEDGREIRFTLAAIEVGQNQKTGRPITSCVVLTVSEKEKLKKEGEKFGFSVKPSEEALLIPMFKAIDRYGKFVATEQDGPAEAIGKHGVDFGYYLDVAVEMDASADDKSAAREKIRKSFERNMRFLIKNGVIGFKRTGDRTAFVWWTGRPIRGFPQTFPDYAPERTNSGQTPDKLRTNPETAASPGLQEALSDDGVQL